MVKVIQPAQKAEKPVLAEVKPVSSALEQLDEQDSLEDAFELSERNLQPVRFAAAITKISCLLPVTNVLSIGTTSKRLITFSFKSWTFFLSALGAVFVTTVIPLYMGATLPGNTMMSENTTTEDVNEGQQAFSLGELQDLVFVNALSSVAIGQVGMNYILHILIVASRYPALLGRLQSSARLVELPSKTIWMLRITLLLATVWFMASTAAFVAIYTGPFSQLPEAEVLVYTLKYLYSTLLNFTLGASCEILFVVLALTLEQLIGKNLREVEQQIRYYRGMEQKELASFLNNKIKAHFKICDTLDCLSSTYCEFLSFNFVTNLVILGGLLYFGIDAFLAREARHRIIVFFSSAILVAVRMMMTYEAGVRPQIASRTMLKKLAKASSRVNSKEIQDKLTVFLVKAQLSPVQMFSAIWSTSPDAHRAGMLALLNTAMSGVAILLQPKINSSG